MPKEGFVHLGNEGSGVGIFMGQLIAACVVDVHDSCAIHIGGKTPYPARSLEEDAHARTYTSSREGSHHPEESAGCRSSGRQRLREGVQCA